MSGKHFLVVDPNDVLSHIAHVAHHQPLHQRDNGGGGNGTGSDGDHERLILVILLYESVINCN